MKSKAPLVLMEQLVMVLVFAVTAVLCMQMFVLSGRLSNQYEAMDWATLEVQSVAEALKSGNVDEYLEQKKAVTTSDGFQICYGKDYLLTEKANAEYILYIVYSEEKNLWYANVEMFTAEGKSLIGVSVAGQI